MIESTVLYTEEIDDLELAVKELAAQAEGFEFQKNSVAILYMDAETEYEELYSMLKDKWNIPFVGMTAMAMLTGKQGYCKSEISIMILTSDNCKFAIGMTGNLNNDNYRDEIKNTYEMLEQELDGEEVKLVLTYGGKIPGMVGDDIVDAVDLLNKKVKLYGALASDAFKFQNYRVFCNDRIETVAQAFVLVTGDVNPKFISVNSISGKANFSYEVTKAEANQVYKLGNGTFLEALEKAGMKSDKTNVITDYIQSPFVITLDKANGLSVEALRNLTFLNHENESGAFLGGIPEGSTLEIGLINMDDVKSTVKKAFEEVFEWLKEEGKNCTTILCCKDE